MKTTNTINNTNIRNINRIAEANIKKAIFVAAKENEPSAKQIARDQKRCAEREKRIGGKCFVTYHTWNWYQELMNNLRITNEYRTGKGRTRIDIVESIFRLTEAQENLLGDAFKKRDSRYDDCIRLIDSAGLRNEFEAWRLARQVHDRNGQMIRVGDIIRFSNITEVCGRPVENGFESKVTLDFEGNVLIAYPVNPWVENDVLHVQAILISAEIAKHADVIIRREEGFVRHAYNGDFRLTCIEMPDLEAPEIFVKKS